MAAMLTKKDDCVSVRIFSKLSYTDWETLRSARNQALASNLPLRIDLEGCNYADIGGIGTIMIAQEKLRDIEICGCSPLFAECFKAFGVCDHCTHHQDDEPCRGRTPVPGAENGSN